MEKVTPQLEEGLIAAAREAGQAILAIYETDFEVEAKADQSPVTEADLSAHAVIVERLQTLTPDIPILSEESAPPRFETRRGWPHHWLVDPLDGTKEFVHRNGDFTVNIALIEGGRPVLGVVGAPVADEIYFGDVKRGIAYKASADGRLPISTRPFSPEGFTVVASRSHGGERQQRFLSALSRNIGPTQQRTVGSSLKLCLLAAGEADLYPRLGPTSEWDIAAAEAVLTAAGGAVWDFNGVPLGYNAKESLLNPEFFAVGDPAFPWLERLPTPDSP